MKKHLFATLLLFTVALVGCTTNNQIKNIESEDLSLAQNGFVDQIEETQYIKDFEDFLSYNILLITENKPYTSDFSLIAKFDKNSSLQGGVDFSQKKFSKSYGLETSDIDFSVIAENSEKDTEPFDLSGSITLLYKDNELYANLHNLNVFMGDGNMVAKMYTLLGGMIIDKWVNMEVHSGGVVEIDENEDKKLPHIVGSFKNILKAENIETNPDFLSSIAEIIDIINGRINIGISTNELKMISHEISYSELGDKNIQKEFTGSFEGKESAFDLSFVASKKGLEVSLYNIREYDDENSDYKDTQTEFKFVLKEKSKSEYSVEFESLKLQQKIVDLEGEIKYGNEVKFSANFVTEPIELIKGQKLSGKMEGNIIKKSGESDREIPEITGEVLLVTELLSSL